MPARKSALRRDPVTRALYSFLACLEVAQPPEIFSYRDDFDYLWSVGRHKANGFVENCSRDGGSLYAIVIWDGSPNNGADSIIDIAARVSVYDWVATLAVRHSEHPLRLTIGIFDLCPPAYASCFGCQMASTLILQLGWVKRYRPIPVYDAAIVSLLGSLGPSSSAHTDLSALSVGLGLVPLLSTIFTGGTGTQRMDEIDIVSRGIAADRVRNLWIDEITKPGGRHDISNLVAPFIMANALATQGAEGASKLLDILAPKGLRGALAELLRAFGLLGPRPIERVADVEFLKPAMGNSPQYFPTGEADVFQRFTSDVRFVLIDDQFLLGYHDILSVLLLGEVVHRRIGQSLRSARGGISLESTDDPAWLLQEIERTTVDWNQVHTFGSDWFDVLFLDLRLFASVGSRASSAAEIDHMNHLCRLYDDKRGKVLGDPQFDRARDAAQHWADGGLQDPVALALFPLLISHVDPSVPIILFSTTQQRSILEAVRHRPNIIASFSKPAVTGYLVDESGSGSLFALEEAIRKALELHEKRTVWTEMETLKNWGRHPVFEIPDMASRTDEFLVYNAQPEVRLPSDRKNKGARVPRKSNKELLTSLREDYCSYILDARYFDYLSLPWELLEGSLTPNSILNDPGSRNSSLFFPQALDSDNAFAWLFKLVRHKKAHGHSRYGSMRDWSQYEPRGRLVSLLFRILIDFIRRVPVADASTAKYDWTVLVLKVAWGLVHRHPHLLTHLRKPTTVLNPIGLTNDYAVPWEDFVMLLIGLSCHYTSPRSCLSSTTAVAVQRVMTRAVSAYGLGSGVVSQRGTRRGEYTITDGATGRHIYASEVETPKDLKVFERVVYRIIGNGRHPMAIKVLGTKVLPPSSIVK